MVKLKASADESELQDLAAETYVHDNEEVESEVRDAELGYTS